MNLHGIYRQQREVKLLFGNLRPGVVAPNYNTWKNKGLLVEVSDEEYQNCLAAVYLWDAKKYGLYSQNCIEFVRDIASVITRLKLPHGYYKVPGYFIDDLKKLNYQLQLSSEQDFLTNKIIEADRKTAALFNGRSVTDSFL